MKTKDQQRLLKLIENGRIKEAIAELLALDLKEGQKKEARTISYRYKELKRKQRAGILSLKQVVISENQIFNDLMELINLDGDKDYPTKESKTKREATRTSGKGKSIGYILGIFGSIASIIALFLYFYPINSPSQAPQLTIYVTDVNGNVVLEHKGELNTFIGNRPLNEPIGENGRTNFGDILPEYLGDSITIGFKAEGWELADEKNTFVFDGKPKKLKVKKDDSLGIIKGTVKTRDGQEFIPNAEIRINSDTIIYSDDNGNFRITLPEDMRVRNLSEAYMLTVIKEGFGLRTKLYYPKTSDVSILLEKNEP